MKNEADIMPSVPDGSGLSREAYALLAQANLLRMRGCWPDAIEKCMQVMALAPNNASAQSLLGDIYDNQGFLDDAIQWYRMALDVQPDSPADRMKLDRLLETKARQLAAEPIVPAPLAPLLPRSSPLLGQLQERFAASPDAVVRWAALVAGILVVVVVLVAIVQIQTTPRAPEHQVSAPPVVLPALTAPPSASEASALAPGADTASAGSRDPNETSLLAKLQASPALTASGVTLTDIQDDPRTGRLTLTYSLLPPATGPLLRDTILRGAFAAAQAAVQNAGADITLLTLRCVATSAGGTSPALLCVTDTTRVSVSAVNSSPLTTDQLAAIFSNLWWSPTVPS